VARLHLMPFFETKKLAQINEKLWAKYIQSAKVGDLANHRKVMTGFLKWAKRKGFLSALPDITEIPHHIRRQRYIATEAELRTIFQHAQGSLQLFCALALFNGMRRKEIMTLSWEGVDLRSRKISVEKAHNKLRRAREMPINDLLVTLLRARHAGQIESKITTPWVFPKRDKPSHHGAIDGLKTAWNTVRRNHGLEHITWHDLRATFEKYSHKSKDHTDTQKEKFSDATMDVQKKIYVTMTADDLRGLEDVVQVSGLKEIISGQTSSEGKVRGQKKQI